MNFRRILNETKQIENERELYKDMFHVNRDSNNIKIWNATLYGPADSPYSGYSFDVAINLSNDYPSSPLNIKFVTKIEHVNINNYGDICMNFLKKSWNSSFNICSMLSALVLLLLNPNPDDPLNSDLAKLYREDKQKYIEHIETACKKYATKV